MDDPLLSAIMKIMNRIVLAPFSVALLLLSACPTAECQFYNDCPANSICNEEQKCVTAESVATCEQGGQSAYFRDLGLLSGTEHWKCALPATVNANGPRITAFDGWPLTVTGGSLGGNLSFGGIANLAGQNLIVGSGSNSWNWVPIESSETPLPIELFLRSQVPGQTSSISIAIDDGTGTPEDPQPGPYFRLDFEVLTVNGGDIQISLSWDTNEDIDIHVLGPDDEKIWYANKTTTAGGELDLDSNVGCPNGVSDIRNENVFWPVGRAPSGEYHIWVHRFSNCDPSTPTNWRLTVLKGGDVEVLEGVADPRSPGSTLADVPVIPPDITFSF